MRAAIYCSLATALVASTLAPVASAEERTLMDFSKVAGPSWQTVNDGVMGGRSQGEPEITSKGTLVFSGEISLENNGGFSSVRTRRSALGLEGFDGIALRVKSDGRGYKVSLRTSNTPGMIAYWAELDAPAGVWTTIRVPFSKWVPTSFGRKLSRPALSVSQINSIGFMLYDKKAGPFTLEVDSISAYRKGEEAAPAAAAKGSNIVETAQAAGTFKTLLAAAKAAGLVGALSGPGPLTVLAPSDEAFAALPAGTVESLLKPENRAKLQAILTFHVVSGRSSLKDVVSQASLTTLNGQRINVGFKAGALQLGGANVVSANLGCSNGVIHVIDRVLLPEQATLVGVADKAKTFKTLLAAAKAAGLAPALSGAGPFTVFAPSDAAFAALPAGTLEHLLQPAQRATLTAILKHHVVSGRVYADQAVAAGKAKTLAGTSLSFGYESGSLRVAGAKLLALDIAASNGVIHVVDRVLLPPQVAATPKRPTLTSTQARQAIRGAIQKGVPLFNEGHEAGCRDLYEATVRELLGSKQLFSSKVVRTLRGALNRQGDAARQAWTLRFALDAAYQDLSTSPTSAPISR